MQFGNVTYHDALRMFSDGEFGLSLMGPSEDCNVVFHRIVGYMQERFFGYKWSDTAGHEHYDKPEAAWVEVYNNGTQEQRKELADEIISDLNDLISGETAEDSENSCGYESCGLFDTESQARLTDRIYAFLKVEDHHSQTCTAQVQ